MFDIFKSYNTGAREWPYLRKNFTESEFMLVLGRYLTPETETMVRSSFDVASHIDVLMFTVPSNARMARKVVFVKQPKSDYWAMFSVIGNDAELVERSFVNNSYRGNMTEYDILDMIEPSNGAHQDTLINTWFDIDSWFTILKRYDVNAADNLYLLEEHINGRPGMRLDPRADEFVPKLPEAAIQS
jgi:hypothetical protein